MIHDTPAPWVLPMADTDRATAAPAHSAGAWRVAAMAAQTPIMTPDGARAAGSLRPGQIVLTAASGAQPILWIWRQPVPKALMRRVPEARPLTIADGALGPGTPRRRIHLAGLAGVFLGEEALATARDLTHFPGIHPAPPQAMTFVQILLPHHDLIGAEGLLIESLHPGRLAQQRGPSPSDAALWASLAAALPGLDHDPWSYGPEAQPRYRRRS